MTDQLTTREPDPTLPRQGECLFCFTDRMLDESTCDGTLRWVRRWRDLRAPRATGLERRLEGQGGSCDCEVFLNGYTLRDDLLLTDGCGGSDWPDERPACAGVRAGSARPCATWVPRRPW